MGITERSAHGTVTDLTEAGYVVTQKDGRRNRYQIQAHLRLPEPASQEPAIGEVLALPAGTSARPQLTRTGPQPEATAAGRACVHPGRRQAPGSPARLIRPEVRDGPQPQAGELLACKRPRLVPVTGKIIVARAGPAGQTWRASRRCLQDESLRRAIEGALGAARQNRQRAPAA